MMTREEAFPHVANLVLAISIEPRVADSTVYGVMHALSALGMLKLDEPASAEERAVEQLAGCFFQVESSTHIYDGKYVLTKTGAADVVRSLSIAGLKVVEK